MGIPYVGIEILTYLYYTFQGVKLTCIINTFFDFDSQVYNLNNILGISFGQYPF